MLKRIVAMTMALIIAIMPMTASAVTWGDVVTALNDKGTYDVDGVVASVDNGYVEVSGGEITANDGENVILIAQVNGAYEYYFKGVKLSADQIKLEAEGQGIWVGFSEETVVDGDVVGEAKGEFDYVEVTNNGTIDGDVNLTASGKGSSANIGNMGEVTGGMNVTISGEEAYGSNNNEGTTGGMSTTASGEDSKAFNINFCGEVVGDVSATASGEGSYVANTVMGGVVGGSMNAEANAEGATVRNAAFDAYYEDKTVLADVSSITSSASNGGTIVNMIDTEVDSLTAVLGEDGKVFAGYTEYEYDVETGTETYTPVAEPEAVNAEKVSNITIVIEAGTADTYTAEQIKAMIEATGMTPTETVYYTVNEDGERTAQYSIGADGSLTFVRQLLEELTAEQKAWLEEQEKIARANHERELKRHAEAIGGVTASPEWVWQLFLGYMSLNLRMYENGEHILFREKLAWAGDGTKNLTLRVNIDEPQALTVRLDEVVLDKLEQAEISLITLLAKDGTPVMQYKVGDLRGAYEMYGLSGADLLVVGGADDEVMKIGADGQMVPVEQTVTE